VHFCLVAVQICRRLSEYILYGAVSVHFAIRLVHLAAGISEDPLQCHIVTTTLEAGSVYEAISYVWGVGKGSV
jgi:hypothetical protein